jgi:hypothetical protein
MSWYSHVFAIAEDDEASRPRGSVMACDCGTRDYRLVLAGPHHVTYQAQCVGVLKK